MIVFKNAVRFFTAAANNIVKLITGNKVFMLTSRRPIFLVKSYRFSFRTSVFILPSIATCIAVNLAYTAPSCFFCSVTLSSCPFFRKNPILSVNLAALSFKRFCSVSNLMVGSWLPHAQANDRMKIIAKYFIGWCSFTGSGNCSVKYNSSARIWCSSPGDISRDAVKFKN